MMVLTREEKERRVLDLYSQGRTYREIAKEARISPRDIGIIVRKAQQISCVTQSTDRTFLILAGVNFALLLVTLRPHSNLPNRF
jgi:DNA-binding NarL/FixJ family response regulator